MLCFVNTVVQVAKGPNAKVFHQQEFLEARFSPEEVEKVVILVWVAPLYVEMIVTAIEESF